MHRLKGELLLKQDYSNVRKPRIASSAQMARSLSAKPSESRGTMSPTAPKAERRDEARAMLAGWFTEGFDTTNPKRRRRSSTN
jgi:hypothetical protein